MSRSPLTIALARTILCVMVVSTAKAGDNRYAYDPFAAQRFQPELNLNSTRLEPPLVSPFRFSVAPDLDIGIATARIPRFDVKDLQDRLWQFNVESPRFDDQKRLTDLAARVQTPEGNTLALQLDGLAYPGGMATPARWRETIQDSAGNTITRVRTQQMSEKNPSHARYETAIRKNYPEVASNPFAKRPDGLFPPPTKELVRGFDETWTLSKTATAGRGKIRLSVTDMDYEDGRSLTSYHGSVRGPDGSIHFEVAAPRESVSEVKSVSVTMHAPGAPSVTVHWTPKSGTDGDKALALLRDNLPVPLLIGPRSAIRLNGVDIPQSPLRVDAQGNLATNQLGRAADLSNLLGHQDLGLTVTAAAPSGDDAKPHFSFGNSLRNLWYTVTGRGTDVKEMRQSLTTLRDQEPSKFLLAAGFRDPGGMSYRDLKAAMENAASFKTWPMQTMGSKIEEAPLKEKTSGLALQPQADGTLRLAPNQTGEISIGNSRVAIAVDAAGRVSAAQPISVDIQEKSLPVQITSLEADPVSGGWRVGGQLLLADGDTVRLPMENPAPRPGMPATAASRLLPTETSIHQEGSDYILSGGRVAVRVETVPNAETQAIASALPAIPNGSHLTVVGKTEFPSYGLTIEAGRVQTGAHGLRLSDGTFFTNKDGSFLVATGFEKPLRVSSRDGDRFTAILPNVHAKETTVTFGALAMDGEIHSAAGKAELKNKAYAVQARVIEKDRVSTEDAIVTVKDNRIFSFQKSYKNEPLPEIDHAYRVDPGVMAQSYFIAKDQAANPANAAWARAGFLALETSVLPLALGEELIGRPTANVLNNVSEGLQFGRRAFFQRSWKARVDDGINTVGNSAMAVLAVLPFANAAESTIRSVGALVSEQLEDKVLQRLNPLNYEVSSPGLGANGGNVKFSPVQSRNFISPEEFHKLPDTGLIDPKRIRFSQDDIASVFRDGKEVSDLISGLKKRSITSDSIPPIRILEKEGKVWSNDNRRLYAFQEAGVAIRYQKISGITEAEWIKRHTTKNDGVSIIIRQ